MKVYALPASENWIIDRIVEEFRRDNHDISTTNYSDADVIWLVAEFCWRHMSYDVLKNKKVVTTIHHVVPEKFNYDAQVDFALRDDITDVYHVPNVHTKSFIQKFTKKPIEVISYWANQNLWHKSKENKFELRKKFGIPINSYVIGSFQRDTEGATCNSSNPQAKLEKGPDLLADAIQIWHKNLKDIHVVLAGWRRQYIIKRLKKENIPYTYIENPPLSVVRDLYQTLDLYPITARYEGGPQSLIECGLLGVPVVSRPVGLATHVLPYAAIHDDVTKVVPTVPSIDGLTLPEGYRKYRELFFKVANG